VGPQVMWGYHEECDHDDTPADVETAIHTYEDSCKSHAECNTAARYASGSTFASACINRICMRTQLYHVVWLIVWLA
jgi:hypothetical protein